MTKDKITDEYIKAVQKQFKHYHAADTRFISDLKDAVISYAAQQDSLDYEQLVSQFGDPQELVNDSPGAYTSFVRCGNLLLTLITAAITTNTSTNTMPIPIHFFFFIRTSYISSPILFQIQ